ncbi:MAG: hypothetical protein RLZZ292_3684 [Bacteroidota bacterium]
MLIHILSQAQNANIQDLIQHYHIQEYLIGGGKAVLSPDITDAMRQLKNMDKSHCTEKSHTAIAKGGTHVVPYFSVEKGEDFILQNDLMLWSESDIVIDGNILGKAIENSNQNGQNLIIAAAGTIYLRGSIKLSNGGNGLSTNPIAYHSSSLEAMQSPKNHNITYCKILSERVVCN